MMGRGDSDDCGRFGVFSTPSSASVTGISGTTVDGESHVVGSEGSATGPLASALNIGFSISNPFGSGGGEGTAAGGRKMMNAHNDLVERL